MTEEPKNIWSDIQEVSDSKGVELIYDDNKKQHSFSILKIPELIAINNFWMISLIAKHKWKIDFYESWIEEHLTLRMSTEGKSREQFTDVNKPAPMRQIIEDDKLESIKDVRK